MSSASPLLDADVFAEVVGSDETEFDADMARALLRLKFSEAQNDRMWELADKANRGTLSEEERGRMESFRRVGNLLALLQARARLVLQRTSRSE